jgi:hypothetical protein
MHKKIILVILSLGVLAGIGYFAVNFNNEAETTNIDESPIPVTQPPTESPKPVQNFSEFGKLITLKLNEKIGFSDGLKVALTAINDSRCQKGVECFWEGELSPVLELSGGSLVNPGEVHLGTVNNKTVTVEHYTFSLKGATSTTATIEVVKK